jgi:putative SOS response-associated peptidase YedK
MCGRFLIEIDEKELKEILSAAENSADERMDKLSFTFSGGEIFPSNAAPVITADGVRFMTWGFPSILENQRPHINARSETAATSKTFGEAMKARRCVVPASAYFEWKQTRKKRKEKYEFTLPMRTPLYMAGIYTIGPEVSPHGEGQFAILTRDAAPAMTDIHDRMPVILPKSLIDVWLKQSPEVMNQAVTDLQFEPVPASDRNSNQLKLFS